jgi:hypothetical protein
MQTEHQDTGETFYQDEQTMKETVPQNGEKATPETSAFERAIKLATIKMNVAVLAFNDGNDKRGLAKKEEAKAILNTIEIFTGRKIDISFTDTELTAYKLVENQYKNNETAIYSYEAPGIRERYYIPNVPPGLNKNMRELGCRYESETGNWYHTDPEKAGEARRLANETPEHGGQPSVQGVVKEATHEM